MSRASKSLEKSHKIEFHGKPFDVSEMIVGAEADYAAGRLYLFIKRDVRTVRRWISIDLIRHALSQVAEAHMEKILGDDGLPALTTHQRPLRDPVTGERNYPHGYSVTDSYVAQVRPPDDGSE